MLDAGGDWGALYHDLPTLGLLMNTSKSRRRKRCHAAEKEMKQCGEKAEKGSISGLYTSAKSSSINNDPSQQASSI